MVCTLTTVLPESRHEQLCSEAAVVGFPHPIKGEAIYAFVTLSSGQGMTAELQKQLKTAVRSEIGAFAAPDVIHWAPGVLPSHPCIDCSSRDGAVEDCDSQGRDFAQSCPLNPYAGLPKTRSGKIMRRILRKMAGGTKSLEEFGDISTLAEPSVVAKLLETASDAA